MAFSMFFNAEASLSLSDDTQQLLAARQKTLHHNMNNALNLIVLHKHSSRLAVALKMNGKNTKNPIK